MEQEHDLQSSTQGYLGAARGPHSNALDRILRNQQVRLGANLALLEKRYEMCRTPRAFQAPRKASSVDQGAARGRVTKSTAGCQSRRATPEPARKMAALIAQAPLVSALNTDPDRDGAQSRGDGLDVEALLKEDEFVSRSGSRSRARAGIDAAAMGIMEGNWENEGGASPSSPRRSTRHRAQGVGGSLAEVHRGGPRVRAERDDVQPWRRFTGARYESTENGAVEVTRTPDRRFRKPLLYPAELPPQRCAARVDCGDADATRENHA